MPKTRRRRRSDQFWRDTITAWKESGQSVTAFCAARGIGESTFFAGDANSAGVSDRQMRRPRQPRTCRSPRSG